MQAKSFVSEPQTLARALPAPQRALVLLLNAWPLAHAAASASALFLPFRWPVRLAATLAVLYLVPPALTRLLFAALGKPRGRLPVSGRPFLVWWASLQLQSLFCRFPALEEALRLLPGAYSSWLRLWGSRVGRLTYWAPGTLVLDRSYLRVGDDVTLGAGVRLNGHVIARDEEGRLELILDDVVLADRCSVGGYGLLTAGCEVAEGAGTRAMQASPPYTRWGAGGRERARESSKLPQ